MLSTASAPQSLQSPAANPSCTHHANSQISTYSLLSMGQKSVVHACILLSTLAVCMV
jgi:hypothetical protein